METNDKDQARLRNVWKPNPKQAEFVAIPHTIKEAAYLGGAGSGKSDILLMYGILNRWHENSQWKQVFMRRTYPELKNEILGRAREIYSKFGATFNKTDMIWTFPRMDQYGAGIVGNAGAQIFLGHCEHEDDVHKYDSMQIPLFTPDEVTSYTEFIYLYIAFERNRSPQGTGLPSITRCAGMPGGIGHCIPGNSDVLTPNGWKNISSFNIGDKVYEVDLQGNLVESIVSQFHAHNYNGKIKFAKTSNLNLICTPEHSIVRKTANKYRNFHLLSRFCDLPYQAQVRRTANYQNNESNKYITLDGNRIHEHDYCNLLGWFLSEGYYSIHNNGIGIAQTKTNGKFLIEKVLQKCKIPYHYDGKQFVCTGSGLINHFEKFGRCRDKFIPREILSEYSRTSLQLLLESLMAGDGHWQNEDAGYYYTISKQLADDFCELATKLGYKVSLSNRQRENRNGLSYEISLTKRSDYTEFITRNDSSVTDEEYNDDVYDIGVPLYHTFVTRQNGFVWISGNSWVKRRFVDPYKEGGKIIIGKGGNKRIFIHATYVDNAEHIDPTYGQSLDGRPEAERKAKKFGDFDAYLGQVFDEFRDKHYPDEPENALHVVPPFEIPDFWPKFVIIDWGFRAMCWVGFFAVSPNKRLYLYKELTWTKTKIAEWGPLVASHIDKHQHRFIKVCKSAGQERGQDHTIQSEIERELGRPVELTLNNPGSRIAGKMLFHEYLRWMPKPQPKVSEQPIYSQEYAMRLYRIQGEQAYKNYLKLFDVPEVETNIPKYQIFCCNKQDHTECSNCCPEAINAIKACNYAENKNDKPAEDVAEFNGDDPYDGQRYAVDAAEILFETAADEFKKFEKQSQLEQKLQATGNWTAFYRASEFMNQSNKLKVVNTFHGRRH